MKYVNEKLQEFNQYIVGKRVAIIGVGVSNLPLLDYFYEHKAKVTVFDNRELDNIDQEAIDKINKYEMLYYFGKNNLTYLQNFDIIFRSPSAMPFLPEIEKEVERGAILTSEIEMVMMLCPGTIIGVTGSDGKTTTTSLIYEILKQKGYRCFLGGNIGIPLFTKIEEMRPEDIVVLELSSFQLMDMQVSPQISVVTNISPNHLNVHRSYEEYIEAKKNIFMYQKETGTVVLNYDNEITRSFAKDAKGKVLFFSSKGNIPNEGYVYEDGIMKQCRANGIREQLLSVKEIPLRGVHNYENICAALAATSSLVDTKNQLQAIKKFKGVEHRIELVREINGVKWYNDSIGTSPSRTMAGLSSFDENIVLIAGGYDKHLDYAPIGKPIVDKVGTLILMGATADKIEKAVQDELLRQGKQMPIYRCDTLEQTVNLAHEKAKPGDVVLFSPASASFDLFKNFEERGNLFKELVKKL